MRHRNIQLVVGVDNGLDGGLCTLSPVSGDLLSAIPMPTRKIGGKREVCPTSVREWLLGLSCKPQRILFAVEEPLKHAKSSQAIRSMAISFGILSAVAEVCGLQTQRVQVAEWQRPMLGVVPKGKTKQRALAVATNLWPEQNWLANSRCRTAHDGMVDAALIGRFASNNLTPDQLHGS